MEGADLAGDACQRHGIRLGIADSKTGEILPVPIERQAELILEQLKLSRYIAAKRDEVQHTAARSFF